MILSRKKVGGMIMLGDCNVCGGSFETLQTKTDVKGDFERDVVYMRCKLCGCGRIDYHPFMPLDSKDYYLEEE
jgi:hypothetical protein